jgi:hypothetical protein
MQHRTKNDLVELDYQKQQKIFTNIDTIRPFKVGTNENGSACGRWLSIGIYFALW